MKKQLQLLLSVFLLSFSVSAMAATSSNWLRLGSAPFEIKYVEAKTEGNITYYRIQLRINKNISDYTTDAKEPKIEGYSIVLGPTVAEGDGRQAKSNFVSIHISKNYDKEYTIDRLFAVASPNKYGERFKLDSDGFMFAPKGSDEFFPRPHEPFSHCFDWIIRAANGHVENRCDSKGYDESNVVDLK